MTFNKSDWDRAQRQAQAANESFAKRMERLQKQFASGRVRIPNQPTRRASSFGRASRNAGAWNRAGAVVSLLMKRHKGGAAGDAYSARAEDAEFVCSNMLGRTPQERATEFALDFARHPGVNSKRLVVHVTLSRPTGQPLSHLQWEAVVNLFLHKLGAQGANFVAIRHTATGNDHVHIVFSRSLPSGKLLSDRNDFWIFRAAACETCTELGVDVPSTGATPRLAPTDRGVSAQRRAQRRGTQTDVWVAPHLVEEVLQSASSFEDFEQGLKGHGIELKLAVRATDGAVTGILYRRQGAEEFLAGSSISPSITLPRVQTQLESNRQAALDVIAMATDRQRENIARHRAKSQTPSIQRPYER